MIRIKREKRVTQLKSGLKSTRLVEISGFRVKDHVIVEIKPKWFRAEEESIRVETWKE